MSKKDMLERIKRNGTGRDLELAGVSELVVLALQAGRRSPKSGGATRKSA